ncbi:MAG: hypothetical protein B9S30_06735 [Verrucomicrobiia bacterium Tous-C5FEB]|nr:MAG: hypothetical protein B9S30_06735 [Verrucomicrobiae bacterium Tous-C5FEB]
MFRRHISQDSLPLFQSDRLIYLTLGDKTVAGYSPLTLLFPAARRLELPESLYPTWFSREAGDWLDPTDPSKQLAVSDGFVNPQSIPAASAAIRTWLYEMLQWLNAGGADVVQILPDTNLVTSEMQRWHNELNQHQPAGQTVISPLPRTGENTPVLDQFLAALAPLRTTVNVDGRLPSDLIPHKGYFLLSRSLLGNSGTKLYGNTVGSSDYAKLWIKAPASGNHLGDALRLKAGERDALPIKFLFVDKLFTPALSKISSGFTPASGWSSLVLDDSVFAYPLLPAAMDFFTTKDIENSLSIVSDRSLRDSLGVHFKFGQFSCEKIYEQDDNSPAPVEIVDNALDLRLFPDYDICSVADKDKQLPAPEDRCHFARFRMGKALSSIENQIRPILEDGDSTASLAIAATDYTNVVIGTLDFLPDHKTKGPGRRLVQTITPGNKRLAGFDFGGKGFILLRLAKSQHPQGGQLEPRTVGIDFGTSNTCLSTLAGHNNDGVLIPAAATTSFLAGFSNQERGNSHEGFAAYFDFFQCRHGKSSDLYSDSFFPTQLASRTDFNTGDFSGYSSFNPTSALICFQSIADLFGEGTGYPNTIIRYNTQPAGQREFEPQIHLKDRLKWDDESPAGNDAFEALRKVFLAHLRLQMIHHEARTSGYIVKVNASYPRAFTKTQKRLFLAELKGIWTRPDTGFQPQVEIFTESHAAAAYLEPSERVEHFLVDIGGGTTDICVFADGKMRSESSVRMAADMIDRYVLGKPSRKLREELFTLFKKTPDVYASKELKNALKDRFHAAETDDRTFENAMPERGILYALLALSKQSGGFGGICEDLAEPTVFKYPSVERFFTTVAILFGGLAYFAGRMHRHGANANDMNGRTVKISFAGNGANHLSWLHLENEKATEKFLAEMFRSGSGIGEEISISIDILANPKAAVALGLVRSNVANIAQEHTVNVYDGIDGSWADKQLSTLSSYYLQNQQPGDSWNLENSELRSMLKALSAAAPEGKIGERSVSRNTSEDWALELIRNGTDKNDLKGMVAENLQKCRNKFRDDIEAGATGMALEPLLIAELKGMLALLRKDISDAQ